MNLKIINDILGYVHNEFKEMVNSFTNLHLIQWEESINYIKYDKNWKSLVCIIPVSRKIPYKIKPYNSRKDFQHLLVQFKNEFH